MLWLFLTVVSSEEVLPTPTLSPTLTPLPTIDDVDVIFDNFLEQCRNGSYSSDSFMSAICEMYNILENDRVSDTSSWVSVIIDLLAFLVGLVGVGYFLYLKIKKCREEKKLKEMDENIEVEIQE